MCKKTICPICSKEYKNYNGLSIHYSKIHNKKPEDLYADIHFNGVKPKCKCGCGKEVPFRDGTNGFRQYYNSECKHNDTTIKKNCLECGAEFKSYICQDRIYCTQDCMDKSSVVVKNRQETNLKRYGVKNALESDLFLDKIKENNLKKHGVEWFVETDEFREKFEETNLKKHGVPHHFSSKKIIDKIKNTNLERYGVENPKQHKSIKIKTKLDYYKKLFSTDRLKDKVKPLFSFDEFKGARREHKYSFECLSCGNKVEDHLQGGRIPRCYNCEPLGINISNAEKELQIFLDDMNIEYISSDQSVLSGRKELDIYIPSYNLAIEFNGLYYHSEGYGIDKVYHLNKTEECEEQGIQLIHIFEDEWNFKNDIVKSIIQHKLNKTERRIYGRNCTIKGIDPPTKNKFLNKYHIQGEDISNVKLGLFHEDELVSVMTFKKQKEREYELLRFSTSCSVIGGASKLFKYFVRNYKNVKSIISFADKRWSGGGLYDILGFDNKYNVKPSYWYTKRHKYRIDKSDYIKSEIEKKLDIYYSELTEWENMQLNGYDRIWDCGSIKFQWDR